MDKNNQIIQLLEHADLMTFFVLFVLAIMSIMVWTVIVSKLLKNRNDKIHVNRWLDALKSNQNLAQINKLSRELPQSGFGRIAREAVKEIEGLATYVSYASLEARYQLVQEAVERSAEIERDLNDRYISILTICSSVGPFLGLFGTVWGIMDSFLSIGELGSANITVVAPGIAEALITTIAGLIVAIPAATAYNLLVSQNRKMDSFIYNFSSLILSLFKRGELKALESNTNP